MEIPKFHFDLLFYFFTSILMVFEPNGISHLLSPRVSSGG
jgi:hypothetical protein